MLKNYYYIDENEKVSNFLKNLDEKKISHYIILDTTPKSFIDIRTIALKTKNLGEKLKGFKKNVSNSNSQNTNDNLNFLIESGDRLIDTENGFYDFIDALTDIKQSGEAFLDETIETIGRKEVFALNKDDKISAARNLFLKRRINILPVIKDLKIIGELRPIDLLVNEIYNQGRIESQLIDREKDNLLNLPISNLMNPKPILKLNTDKIKEAVDIMINKKIPSVIVIDEDEKLYSIVSYKDIFRLYKDTQHHENYLIQYVKGDELFEDEFDLIQDFAEKTMKKIEKVSDYDNLKVSFKTIGEKDSGHKKKINIKLLLSKGNQVLQVEKETSTGTNDEEFNDKVKADWNIPQMAQMALNALEKKVKDEKNKRK